MRPGISLLNLQIAFLIVLQLISLWILWTSNPISQAATDTFALYLSMDLVAFAILSYIYRSKRGGRSPRQVWIVAGYLSLVVFLVSNLIVV